MIVTEVYNLLIKFTTFCESFTVFFLKDFAVQKEKYPK